MKKTLVIILFLATLTSWNADTSGPWNITIGKRICVYSRPIGFSNTDSPDNPTIQSIIQEQDNVIEYINKQLHTNFDSRVKIFLFNNDEADNKLGTSSGGFSDKKKDQIYFTFFKYRFYNSIRNEYEFIGVHEMVHLITRNQLGRPKTRFCAEGYSNAIDGNYGSIVKNNIYKRVRNDSIVLEMINKGVILSAKELLNNDQLSDNKYYPQIGYLFQWLFKEYGVEKINKLYPLNKNQILNNFLSTTGESFDEMNNKYVQYIKNK